MNDAKPQRRHDKRFLILGLVLLLALAGAGGYYLGTRKDKTRRLNAVVLQNSIQEISELATVEYNYTTMARYENHKEFYGYTIPFTTSRFIVSYDGVIKAGIDFSQAAVQIEGDTITVTLPAAGILSHEIDYDSLELMEDGYSIFNPITITDYSAFYADQSAAMEEKALQKGLLDTAEANAEQTVASLIATLTDHRYTVKFIHP